MDKRISETSDAAIPIGSKVVLKQVVEWELKYLIALV